MHGPSLFPVVGFFLLKCSILICFKNEMLILFIEVPLVQMPMILIFLFRGYFSSASGMYEVFRPIVGEALREMPLALLITILVSDIISSQIGTGARFSAEFESTRHRMWIDLEQFLDFSCMHGPNCKLGSFCTVGRRLQEVNVLGGLILPVWGTVERVLSKQVRYSSFNCFSISFSSSIFSDISWMCHVRYMS
nr:protein FORGETTER 1-like isoform X1 [Nicotiana tomentosiformis]